MGKILETILHGQKIGFHPQRVLLLPDLDAMLVADIHLGKAEFMQGKGIPLSNLPHQKDHERLVKLIKEFQVKQLFILGDLVHRTRQNPQSLQRLIRDLHPLAMEVHWIQGN
ncbi:MAG: metallophosphoesterase, partial [SAR324 cluster bacterium]|nr:metallophosphoesterase [SAR324 cluster bacterium]